MNCYLISGWDNFGNQIVSIHKGNTEEEGEQNFIASLKCGGEVNEVLDKWEDK